jgi:hypothetical protein
MPRRAAALRLAPKALRPRSAANRARTAPRRPQFALPGLLYRNIATTDLYGANWGIVGASLTFKVRASPRCAAALKTADAR